MIILTIDTDWAPEPVTAAVLQRVRGLGVKVSVFFSTAPNISLWPQLELGCHPDLSKRQPHASALSNDDMFSPAALEHNKSVEEAEEKIIKHYRQAIPQASALRTHRFYWHSDLAKILARNDFIHDSSLILPYHPELKGFRTGRITRWPVWASDHLHLARQLPCQCLEMPNFNKKGLKIFCFHIAYLYLNCSALADFNMIHTEPGQLPKPLNGKAGIWNLFELLAERAMTQKGGSRHLSEIEEDFISN